MLPMHCCRAAAELNDTAAAPISRGWACCQWTVPACAGAWWAAAAASPLPPPAPPPPECPLQHSRRSRPHPAQPLKLIHAACMPRPVTNRQPRQPPPHPTCAAGGQLLDSNPQDEIRPAGREGERQTIRAKLRSYLRRRQLPPQASAGKGALSARRSTPWRSGTCSPWQRTSRRGGSRGR